ncbi:TIGR03086 family metal-binding protein [Geodermatophilus marinus]|uniref:TIGR03086 family metal-binding protein n=1 Tax=Geodermatophilus sp. LHW52908 TaxID=2303986 RepID=UPI000E3C18A0|nr:TIGR03086 family metal-binding protein [Geodermatophilus sp. LHW52908]RFU20739.1 TIGR03086 family protein [Geodermatophilus sp. LHW52908]
MTTSTLPATYDRLAEAAAEAARIARGAARAPLDSPTPDAGWDLRALVNHWVLYSAHGLERRARREPLTEELTARDFAGEPDWAERYAAQLDRALAAWRDPAAWEGEIDLGGMRVPAADVAGMLVKELVLHGWDVARATGQEITVPEATARLVLDLVVEHGALFREHGGFAGELPVPAGAGTLERALRLSGRDPAWRP